MFGIKERREAREAKKRLEDMRKAFADSRRASSGYYGAGVIDLNALLKTATDDRVSSILTKMVKDEDGIEPDRQRYSFLRVELGGNGAAGSFRLWLCSDHREDETSRHEVLAADGLSASDVDLIFAAWDEQAQKLSLPPQGQPPAPRPQTAAPAQPESSENTAPPEKPPEP